MTGQAGQGNAAISMLTNIHGQSVQDQKDFTKQEADNLKAYNDKMKTLSDAEADLLKDIDDYELSLAKSNKDKEEATRDLAEETEIRDAAQAYLDEIRPGCTFIQD